MLDEKQINKENEVVSKKIQSIGVNILLVNHLTFPQGAVLMKEMENRQKQK